MTERRREDLGLDVTMPTGDAAASADTAVAKSRGIDSVMQSASMIASANTVAQSIDRPIPAGPEVLPVVDPAVYIHLDEFARGGLGRIVRAKDTRTGRVVAIKEMLHSSADAAARFVREALVTANLQHPAIVPVYEVGRWTTGQPFYAMKLVSGRPLDQAIAGCKDIDERLALVPHIVTVADALAYAHGVRVIHRDLKPANVLCGAHGETVVIDWGLARRLDDQDAAASIPRISSAPPGATYVGAVMGTPSYMPPEQARGERVDERADVYAIGAMLYQTLSGRAPYVGKTLQELIENVKAKPPAPLREIEPRVPPDLAAIVERAMAREIDKRYPSAKELASDLKRFTDGQLVLAHHYTKGERVRRFVARNRGILAIASIGLVTLAVVGAISFSNVNAARKDEAEQRALAVEKHDEAKRVIVTAYVDRARAELAAGQAEKALAFAVAAARAEKAATGKVELDPEVRFIVGRALETLPGARRRVADRLTALAFVPGSDDLILANNDGAFRWAPDRDERVWVSPGMVGDVVRIDDKTIAAGRDDGVTLIDIATGKTLGVLTSDQGRKQTGIVGTDRARRWLAAPTATSVELFDATKRARVASIPIAGVNRLHTVSADGMKMVVGTPPKESLTAQLHFLDRAGKMTEVCFDCWVHKRVGDNELVVAKRGKLGQPATATFMDWSGKERLVVSPNTNAEILHIDADTTVGRFAIVMADGMVEVRDLATGKLAWRTTLNDRGYHAEFDHSGRLWLLGNYMGVVAFDATSGVQLGRWNVGGYSIAVAEDRNRVAIVHAKTGVATWPIGDGAIRAVSSGPTRVRRLLFLDGGGFAGASDDGAINIFDEAGQRREIGRHAARITELVKMDDGALLSSSRDNTTVVRGLDGTIRTRIPDGPRTAASVDGWIATGNGAGQVTLWDRVGKQLRVLGIVGKKSLMALRWSPDGKLIGGIDENAEVKVWSRDGALVLAIPAAERGIDITFSPDGKWLGRSGDGTITQVLFSLTGGKHLELANHNNSLNQVFATVFTRDGKRVLSVGSGLATVWNTTTGAIETNMAVSTDLTSAAFLVDDRLIAAGGTDRKVYVWHAATGALIATANAPDEVFGLTLERSEKHLGVLTLGAAMVWRLSSFRGDLEALEKLERCRTEIEVPPNGIMQPRPFDHPSCNKLHTSQN